MKRGPPLDAALCRRLSRRIGGSALLRHQPRALAAYVAKQTA
jgi:hypothetical protein